MRSLLFFFLTFFTFSFSPSYSQIGWKWGITNSSSDTTHAHGIDVLASSTDNFGNVFAMATVIGGDTTFLDTLLVTNGYHLHHQMIIIKADSTGHYNWAIGTKHSGVYLKGGQADIYGNCYVYGWFDSSSVTIDTTTLVSTGGKNFLLKISPTGNILWAKQFRGLNFGNIDLDGAGNIYTSGGFIGSVTLGSIALSDTGSTSNVYVSKFDPSGNVIWAKYFGGNSNAISTCLATSNDGTTYVYGYFISPAPGFITIEGTTLSTTFTMWSQYGGRYLTKIDSGGSIIWARNMPNSYIINAIVTDENNQLYATGELDSSTVAGSSTLINYGAQNLFLAKYDSTGHLSWASSAGGTDHDFGYSLTRDCNGNIWTAGQMGGITAGSTYSMNFNGHILNMPPGSSDAAFVAEYDSLGTFIQSIGLVSGGDDYLGIKVDNRGNFYLIGDEAGAEMIFNNDTISPCYNGEALIIAKYMYDSSGCFTPPPLISINENITSKELEIFPNPATNTLNVKSAEKITVVTIFNVLGQIIYSDIYANKTIEISTSYMPKGLYFMKINNKEIRKFIKQ